MKNLSSHIGLFEIVRREPPSVNGDPRFLCRVDRWTCYTAPDSSLGYKVQNFVGKRVQATIGTHYGRATLNSISLQEGN